MIQTLFRIRVEYWTDPSTNVYLTDNNGDYTLGQVYHVVAQKVGDSFEIWTNGVLSASGTTGGTHGAMDDEPQNLKIGRRGNGQNDFRGRMDDVYLRQGSLSSNQVQQLYGAGKGYLP